MGLPKKGKYKPIAPGTKRNHLVFIEELPEQNKPGIYMVRCLCDCGQETITRKGAFLQGTTKSCGCAQKVAAAKSCVKKRIGFGESNMKAVFKHYARGAVTRKLKFDLTLDQFKYLTQQPCSYCGSLPAQVYATKSHYGEFVYNGIDRINNDYGYIRGNVCPCCGVCNKAKGRLTRKEFLEMAFKIATHRQAVVNTG